MIYTSDMDSNKHTTIITTTTTATSQMNSMNSNEKLLTQNIQNLQSSQSFTSTNTTNATIATSYNNDGISSGDNRNTTNTISNFTITLSPNTSISSAMHAAGSSSSSNGAANKNANANSNACQPRLHPKKRKFNIADLEEMDTTVHANSHSHNINNNKNHNNNNNNNTIDTNKNNGSQNGTDFGSVASTALGTAATAIAVTPINSTPIQSDIIDKTNNNVNWPIPNDNGLRASNAIIVTHVGPTAASTIAHSNEHTLVVSSNSHLNSVVPTSIAHDGKGSHSQFSQNNRKTDNGSTKTDNGPIMIARNEYPVIASHELSTSINSSNPTPNLHHRSPRSNEPLKYGVQSSSIIRIAGPATAINTTANDQPSLDLSEWCDHRVLARQEDIYVAGIIRSVDSSNTIKVEFDYPEGTQQSYYDVLGTGRFDIISDASPSVGDIQLGTRVVCPSQTNRQGHASFIEGEITQILNDTKQFVVRTIASDEIKTVKRAQIRLLQPPWWDELNDINTIGDSIATARVITSQVKSIHGLEPSIYTNTMAGAVAAAAAASNTLNPNGTVNASNNRNVKYVTPLQVHHLLPTVQTSEDQYRTAATSPFPLSSNSISETASTVNAGLHPSNSNQIPEIIVSQQTANTAILTTAPGGATIERGIVTNETEIRRSHQRSYDDYESDDELRREDISFTIDGGENLFN